MYLLLALGLWIYVIARFRKEKVDRSKSSEEHTVRFAAEKNDHDMFLESYAAPDDMEEQARAKVYRNDQDAQFMRDMISSEAGIIPTADMLVRALLAQHGKISKKAAYSGFRTSPSGMKSMEEERKFLVWYDKELRAHGVGYKLLFTTWNDNTKLKAGDLSVAKWVAENNVVTSGVYFWEPIRGFVGAGDSVITQ